MHFWEILLVVGYTGLFAWLLYRLRWWSVPGIPRTWVVGGFLIKVMAAIGYGILHYELYGWSDTFKMYENGLHIARLLPAHPDMYLRLVFGPSNTPLPESYHIIEDGLGFWRNTASHMMVRFHALLAPISGGSYYVHAVWMGFFTWGALLMLVRLFREVFQWAVKPLFLLVLFLPTVLIFGSGLHKEGLMLIAVALILSGLHRILKGWNWRAFIAMGLGWILLFLVKEYYFAALLPGAAALVWVLRSGKWVPAKFAVTALAFWVLAFTAHHIVPSINLAALIESKQEEFFVLKGSSNIEIPNLEPNALDLVMHLPTAAANVIVRPYPADVDNLQLLIYALETWLLLLIVLLAFIFPRPGFWRNPWWWALVLSALAAFFIIGLIVPNLGAIARYRTPAWLIWTIAWASAVHWERIFGKYLKHFKTQ